MLMIILVNKYYRLIAKGKKKHKTSVWNFLAVKDLTLKKERKRG